MNIASKTKKQSFKTISAAAAGNFIEWYDWGVYGVVATVLARQFFPQDDYQLGLVSVFALFAVSYLARPLGTVIFGHIADSVGRRKALTLTIVITCVATALIGCLPTYDTVGVVAPVLLLIIRLAQALGTGGEYSTAISFVYEHGEPGRKARSVGVLASMTFVGILVGSLLATLMSAVLTELAYESWGWRVLFLLALPFGLIGVYLRSKTSEGEEFKAEQQNQKMAAEPRKSPLSEAVKHHWRRILLFIGFLGTWSILSATMTSYLATFLKSNDQLSGTQAYVANTIGSAMVVVFVLAMSPLADLIGLRRMSIVGAGCVVAFVIPGFWLASQGAGAAFVGAGLLGAVKGVLAVPSLLAVSQIFPPSIRVTAGGLSYNISQSVLGGTAPLVAVWLNSSLDSHIGFAYYLILAGLVTIVIAFTCAKRWVTESFAHSGDAGFRGPSSRDSVQ